MPPEAPRTPLLPLGPVPRDPWASRGRSGSSFPFVGVYFGDAFQRFCVIFGVSSADTVSGDLYLVQIPTLQKTEPMVFRFGTFSGPRSPAKDLGRPQGVD